MQDASEPSALSSTSRRGFLLAASGIAGAFAANAAEPANIALPRLHAPTEADDEQPAAAVPPDHRVGFAVVGLGDLSIKHILPAFGQSRDARLTALVSGHRDKAMTIAREYGIQKNAVLAYTDFEHLAAMREVDAVYIVLPNSLHAEFTMRAARSGKHVLCEKPMATSSADCRKMIEACEDAGRKLMIAYRSQYEPHNRMLKALLRDGKLGKPKGFISSNSQNMGPVDQWRLNKTLAGGGPLVDVGIYCINEVRFLTGEEPVEVSALQIDNPADPRFAEVEEAMQFNLRFASGLNATCWSSYALHKSQFARIEAELGWAELNPAYAYEGQMLSMQQLLDGHETRLTPSLARKDQFALELDHFAECIRRDQRPHTPGEEGLQDQLIIEAIYESARTRRGVALQLPQVDRGPEPD